MASVTDDPASSASCGPLSAEEIAALVADFPHFEHAFVYGSALVAPASGSIPMTDLVFAVREAEVWHALNLEKHAAHYSPLGMLGPRAVAAVQERAGAGVYYNAYVPWRGRRIKYGVVSVSALLDDLRCWRSLYLAGRMHKPVQTVKSDPLVCEAAEARPRHRTCPGRVQDVSEHVSIGGRGEPCIGRRRRAADAAARRGGLADMSRTRP